MCPHTLPPALLSPCSVPPLLCSITKPNNKDRYDNSKQGRAFLRHVSHLSLTAGLIRVYALKEQRC